jgi:hypothetical protein
MIFLRDRRLLIIGVSGLVVAVILFLLLWVALWMRPSVIHVRAGLVAVLVCLTGWTLTLSTILRPAISAFLLGRPPDRRKPVVLSRQAVRRAVLLWSLLAAATITSIVHVQFWLRRSLAAEAGTAFDLSGLSAVFSLIGLAFAIITSRSD